VCGRTVARSCGRVVMSHSDEILLWFLLWLVVTLATVAISGLTTFVVGLAEIRRDYAGIQNYCRDIAPRAGCLDPVRKLCCCAPPARLFGLIWPVFYAGLLAVRTAMSSCAYNLATADGLLHTPVSAWHAVYIAANLLEAALSAMWYPVYFGAGHRRAARVILALDVIVSVVVTGMSFETSQCIRISTDDGDAWHLLIILFLFAYLAWLLFALGLNWVGCIIEETDGSTAVNYHPLHVPGADDGTPQSAHRDDDNTSPP
jgi:hypothetical protein